MSRLRTVLAEDEPRAMDRLRMFVRKNKDIEIVAECADGISSAAAIRDLKPDLVFLDIQLPGRTGFEVLLDIGVIEMPMVIFVTAYDEYAVKAFEVCALDYILKPFDQSRVDQSIQRALAQKNSARPANMEQKLLQLLKMQRSAYLTRILVKSGERLTFLDTQQIDWIKADGNYLELHHGGQVSLLRESMSKMESQLDPEKFLRVHRSLLVRVEAILEIQRAFTGNYTIVMTDRSRLPMSRRCARSLPAVAEKLR